MPMVRTRVLPQFNPAWELGLYDSKMAAVEMKMYLIRDIF